MTWNDCPLLRTPASQARGDPASLVLVCDAPPVFVQVTMVPGATVKSDGWKAKSTMAIAAPLGGVGVRVAVAVGVDVGDDVTLGVGEAVGVGILVGVEVGVGEGVLVATDVPVAVGVLVGVAVGSASCCTW